MEKGATQRNPSKIKESRGRKPAFSGNDQSVEKVMLKFVRTHLRELAKNKRIFKYTMDRDAKTDVSGLMKYKDLLCESRSWFRQLE